MDGLLTNVGIQLLVSADKNFFCSAASSKEAQSLALHGHFTSTMPLPQQMQCTNASGDAPRKGAVWSKSECLVMCDSYAAIAFASSIDPYKFAAVAKLYASG